MSYVLEFVLADVLQALAFGGEFFVYFDGGFGHGGMSFLGAADQREIGPGGNAFMAIGVNAQSEHDCFLFFLWRAGHVASVRATGDRSKWNFSPVRSGVRENAAIFAGRGLRYQQAALLQAPLRLISGIE